MRTVRVSWQPVHIVDMPPKPVNIVFLGTAYGKLVDGFHRKGGYMSDMGNGVSTVTLRVNRFAPRPDRDRGRGGSPFAKKSSPFGDRAHRRGVLAANSGCRTIR